MGTFESAIKHLLTLLSNKARILFAVITAEKLYPHYVEFQNESGWGDKDILIEATSLIYYYLIDARSVNRIEIENMLKRINRITPDTNDFSGILTSFALDACTAVISTLDYLLEQDVNHIIYVSTYATDSVDMYIQEKENMVTVGTNDEIMIENDFFMVGERNRQLELISKLSQINLDVITDDLIASLRDNEPIINLSLL